MAFGNQLVQAHIALRERLEELRDGLVDGARVVDLRTHCLSFCAALERHHTAEDDGVFPVLAREHPELRPVLDELGRDHRIVSEALTALAGLVGSAGVDPVALAREVDGVAALVETHFTYEERKIADLLSALTGRLGAADAALITRATTVTDG
ncbi:hemerythrin domain-containing protein [Saccharothrix saharensis]|uniref:hemerythrin domain-containing protein n=1 Tax=Saccharothrix saharensis TaxID=571190 RepID=UPI00368DDE14